MQNEAKKNTNTQPIRNYDSQRNRQASGHSHADFLAWTAAGDEEVKADLQELAEQPDDHQPFSHPYYWGAFICQGDPAPMP